MGNAPFVPRGKQGRALCFRLKQANTSRLSKKPQNRLEQKTSGRYKLVVQEGQALRMGIIGNTLIESPRTPFSANTLLWTLKCPERSEPLGFGHLRVFLIFPIIYAAFRAFALSTGIGHTKEKSSKSKREKKKLYDLNPFVQY